MLTKTQPFRLGIILTPNFSLMAFASTIEPLRSANYLFGRRVFDWVLLTPAGELTTASCGVAVQTEPLERYAAPHFTMVLTVGGIDADRYWSPPLGDFLRKAQRYGAMIGGVSTGIFVLARAGLLDGKRCAIHWTDRQVLEELYPKVYVENALYVFDHGLVTCAGGTAAIDMMLQVICDCIGPDLSKRVSDQFIHGIQRDASTHQRMELRDRVRSTNHTLLASVQLMEESVHIRLTCAEIAQRTNTTVRNLERLFKNNFDCSPAKYYLTLRMERSRFLLRRTTMSITEIALSCGFETLSHFSKSYRKWYGVNARNDRK